MDEQKEKPVIQPQQGDVLQTQEAEETAEQQEVAAQEEENVQPTLADYEFNLQIDETDKTVTKQMLWERKLLDFSLRNNLLNTRLGRRVVPFMSFEIENLEDHLHAGEDYTVQPTPDVKQEPGANGMYNSHVQVTQLKEHVLQSISAHRIISYLTESELQGALKYLYRTSRTQMEENGANSLFLVLGVLRWYENERTEQSRFAPLLMLPVDIVRHGVNNYVIRTREENTILNITLVEFLKHFFKINLDFLSPLPADENGVDVRKIFDDIIKAIAPMKRWEVMEESLLGLFSFNKFVMWNDIHTHADLLAENPIVSSLIDGRIKWDDSEQLVDARKIDKQNQPADFAIPMDVDSSQIEAVVESGKGKSFILYGPPGTGKSQTITNMIANALYQGRRVLFVAEKMAALEVVQKRLTKIGLDAFCLELHSNKVTKRHFLAQMQKALDARHLAHPEDYAKASERLFNERQQLIGNMEALHRRQSSGLSLYDCISAYLAIDAEGDAAQLPSVETITKDDINHWQELPPQLDTILTVAGHPHRHPLEGLEPREVLRTTADELQQLLSDYRKHYRVMAESRQAVASGFPLELSLWGDYDWLSKLSACLDRVENLSFLSVKLDELKSRWAEVNQKWFLPRFFARRSFLKQMSVYGNFTKHNVDDALQNLENIRSLQDDYATAHGMLKRKVADVVKALKPETVSAMALLAEAYQPLSKTNESLQRLAVFDIEKDGDYWDRMADHIEPWFEGLPRLKDWLVWVDKKRELCNGKTDGIVTLLERDGLQPAEAVQRQTKEMYHQLVMHIVDSDPKLRKFNGLLFEDIIRQYVNDTNYFQQLSRKELYCRLAASIPSQTMEAVASSEMGILKRNIMNGGRGMSIRAIIDHIPTLLPRLCPCMLMSPISVAQYLDLTNEKFDLVIFDEASQMPTSEAIGAIARGRALIVVGDPKQMPPTSFFSASQTDEDEVAIDDLESILDDCIALSVPAHHLTWHYRSRHESLIAFSNQQYYDASLLTFPSVDDRCSKVTLVHVESAYDRGRTRSNPNEARAIVNEVVRRLSDNELSRHSIGIVSFSKVQQDLIEDMLTEELAARPKLESVAYGQAEPIFVKNLENVQGDERDVILFSVGYGPDKEGRVSMNFGPLNNNGGERRLNVAVSRARHEMVVYSSLTAEQIDLNRTKAKGVEGLRNFLKYAECGRLPQMETSPATETLSALGQGPQTLDPMARQIVDVLRENGYEADVSVGRSSFKIDVAVIDRHQSDRYVLGILCDGRTYYETKTARDREVVQPSVLHGLAWNIMRVWSIDWYENRDRVIERIIQRLADIEANRPERWPSDKLASDFKFNVDTIAKEEAVVEDHSLQLREEYRQAELSGASLDHLTAYGRVQEAARTILLAEQPVVESYLCKRVAHVLGLRRAGVEVQRNVRTALTKIGYQHPLPEDVPPVWWAHEKRSRIYKGFRTAGPREASELPLPEVMNAAVYIVEQQTSLPTSVLEKLTAQCFGFIRLSAKLETVIRQAVHQLYVNGRIDENDGMISSRVQA